jgi:hypothetical protein
MTRPANAPRQSQVHHQLHPKLLPARRHWYPFPTHHTGGFRQPTPLHTRPNQRSAVADPNDGSVRVGDHGDGVG